MAPYITAVIVAAAALAARLPFLRFPMDEDFAFYAYRARFAAEGIRWKKDVFLIYPAWKMPLLDAIYGNPANGVTRIRIFLSLMHAATSLAVCFITAKLTGVLFAGAVAGILYALFATAPSLTPNTVNMEQLYLPFLLIGMYLLMRREFALAGLFFGLAAIPKIAAGLYIPLMALAAWWQFNLEAALWFAAAGAIAGFGSRALDRQLGYLDAEAKRQYATRYAVAVRLGALKRRYGDIAADIKTVLRETMPAWLIGLPALAFLPLHPQAALLAAFLSTTLLMTLFQQGYSRYHYLPFVAVMACATGFGLVNAGIFFPGAVSLIIIAALLQFDRMKAFYLKPLAPSTLAQYDKYDQYLYIPRLGRALGRLIRMRGERGRMFVWGNYTQIYHHAGLPAADAYIHYAVGPWDDERLAGYYDTVIGGLLHHKPLYLVKTFPNLDMELLEEMTGLKYRLITTAFARFPVYRLESSRTPEADPLALPWETKLRHFEKLTAGENMPGVDKTDMEAGATRRAIKECRKAIRINSGDTQALHCLDTLYDAAAMAAEGRAYFEKLLARNRRTRHVRLILARRAMAEGNMEKASDLIAEEAAAFSPSRDTEFMKACWYEQKGEYAYAGEIFWKLVEREPENPEFALHLAVNMEKAGEAENARTVYNETWALARHAGQGWIRLKAAEGLARLDNAPLSRLLAERLPDAGGDETIRYALASAYDREGEKEKAEGLFRELAHTARVAAVRGGALYRLALATWGEERKRLLAECLTYVPDHRAAKKLLEEM
ncbi:MAG: hypothetical protein HZA03_02175 [Nitrospinae bacterium]|nr:hypothetical protein [Nitrospinota bacterium]